MTITVVLNMVGDGKHSAALFISGKNRSAMLKVRMSHVLIIGLYLPATCQSQNPTGLAWQWEAQTCINTCKFTLKWLTILGNRFFHSTHFESA